MAVLPALLAPQRRGELIMFLMIIVIIALCVRGFIKGYRGES